jgi:hypothetical protein
MGNSAGGVHLSTFMLHPKFLAQRKELLSSTASLHWKGAITVGVPAHFGNALPSRGGMLTTYYGTSEQVQEHCPYGLLQAAGSKEGTFAPDTLALISEWDPLDEITQPMRDFVELWEKKWSTGIELREIEGHNHISPPLVLMSGEGEQWGEDIVAWIKERSA